MAKPNYAFEKRQRDLAKKAKKEEKRQRKVGSRENPEAKDSPEPTVPPPADTDTPS
ncbi:hypothetical protein [Thiorhodococcus mannitoliphagus]|uniref:hypothetical protein n=1 Tax=Thiorhodococcus mannitoliphagus TaxID=329406 RepID=UPI001430FE4B|nr:hypothetical protein [Thiorhodococcus mannitoliphagus]